MTPPKKLPRPLAIGKAPMGPARAGTDFLALSVLLRTIADPATWPVPQGATIQECLPGIKNLVERMGREHIDLMRITSLLEWNPDVHTARAMFDGVSYDQWRPWSREANLAVNVWRMVERILEAETVADVVKAFAKFEYHYLPILDALKEDARYLRMHSNVAVKANVERDALHHVWLDLANLDKVRSSVWGRGRRRPLEYDSLRVGIAVGLEAMFKALGIPNRLASTLSWEELRSAIAQLEAAKAARIKVLGAYHECLLVGRFPLHGWGSLIHEFKAKPISRHQELLEAFLWYHVHALRDGADTLPVGMPLLLSAVDGMLARRRRNAIKEPVRILEIRHPRHHAGDAWFSYALLVETFGSIGSDYSGWVLFPRIGGDYGGFGGHLYESIKEFLALQGNRVDVTQLSMSYAQLARFTDKVTPGQGPNFVEPHTVALTLGRAAYQDMQGNALSLLLELGAQEFLRSHYEQVVMSCVKLNLKAKHEIDVYANDKSQSRHAIVECKISLATVNLNEELTRLADAKAELAQRFPLADVKAYLASSKAASGGWRGVSELASGFGIDLLWAETDLAVAFSKGHARARWLNAFPETD